MKYLIIQGDGMADWPDAEGLTPLMRARTPHFNRIASCGELGLVQTIPADYPPGSDVGNLSLFGYDPCQYYCGRSPLEAAAMGVALGRDDIALRMNLVSLSADAEAAPQMADYSAGHIADAPAAQLVNTFSADFKAHLKQSGRADLAAHIDFYAGVGYRHLMVWHGGGDQLETTPPHDITDQAIAPHLPRGADAALLNEVMTHSAAFFQEHPVNQELVRAGGRAVSQVWLWGQGRACVLPSFQRCHGLRGACISAVDLVRGVATLAGFTLIDVPGATGYLDTDYDAKARYALQTLEDGADLMFLHVEAPDEAGHMGSAEEKIKAIESIDSKIVGPLLDALPRLGDFKVLITSDHATPYSTKTHSAEAVPFALASAKALQQIPSTKLEYGESEALRSGILLREGHLMMHRLLSD